MNGTFAEKIRAYGMLMKPRVSRVFSLFWATLIGLFVAKRGIPPLVDSIKALAAVSAIANCIYVYNDTTDIELDIANKSDRPLATGKVSKKDALTLVSILTIVAILISVSINWETLLLGLAYLTLGFAYSNPHIRLKKRFIIKQLTPAIGGFISSLIGGTAIGLVTGELIFVASMFFALIFVGAPLLDLKDMFGDKKYECKTFPIVFGPRSTVMIAASTVIFLGIVNLLFYPLIGFSYISGILLSVLCFGFALVILPLLRSWRDPVFCEKTIRRMILLNFLIQLSFIVGSI